jgi:hypothetical protein
MCRPDRAYDRAVGVLLVIFLVAAVASRPIEVRRWREGRLSDRSLALLLLARFPILVGLVAAQSGGPVALTVFVIAVSLAPAAALYPVALSFIRDQRSRQPTGR